MRRRACCSVLLLLLAGCGSSQVAELGKAPETPSWPALDALREGELLRPILMAANMGNGAMVKEKALDPKFQEAIAKFEAEAMPSKYATPARTQAHAEVIKNFKALIEGAKSGASDDDLKNSALAGNKALNSLVEASAPAAPAK